MNKLYCKLLSILLAPVYLLIVSGAVQPVLAQDPDAPVQIFLPLIVIGEDNFESSRDTIILDIDPITQTVKKAAAAVDEEAGGGSPSDLPRRLRYRKEIALTDIDIRFLKAGERIKDVDCDVPEDQGCLIIWTKLKNVTPNEWQLQSEWFLQPFSWRTSTTDVVSSVEPMITNETLGGDNVLSPQEATTELTFKVVHAYRPFYYYAALYAAVAHEEPPLNQPPIVDAGIAQTITLPMNASLDGIVTDDGLPNNRLVVTWTKASGAGNVTFADAHRAQTTATFSKEGNYVLRLEADDGEFKVDDMVAITMLSAAPSDAELRATQHMEEVMDKYHQTFDVYTDVSAAGNHFVHRAQIIPPGQSGSGLMISDGFTGTVRSGATSILNQYDPAAGAASGGWYFMVGMLEGKELIPKDNWGTYPDAGHDLTGATQLTFWAKGEKGGERVEFFAFGVGRTLQGNPEPDKTYPDSEAKTTVCGRLRNGCYITLTDTWQLYTIEIDNPQALTYVLGGFGWFTTAAENNHQPITFYLDDIQYNKARLDEPRFLLSFEAVPSGDDFDTVMKNVSFVYDNALALMNFVKAGDHRRAQLLADAFVYAQKHDRYFSGERYDGRLRNTYQAGDLTTPPGWAPNGITGTVRLPGWWDPSMGERGAWLEDGKFLGTDTGNMSWAILALLTYYEEYGGEKYLNAAIDLGNWIAEHTIDYRGAGGFMGGYSGNETNQRKEMWKSTEHNLDLIPTFERLHLQTGDHKWRELAIHARRFVEAMWVENPPPLQREVGNPGCNGGEVYWTQDRTGGFFWTGTAENGITVNQQAIPLDGQTWALMVLGHNSWTERAIDFVEKNHVATYQLNEQIEYEGFDFNEDRDLPWMEGTGQMVIAYKMLGRQEQAEHYLNEMREMQDTAPRANGKGIVASPVDGLTTGFNWCYFNRLHIGATSWMIMAEQGYNGYWHRLEPPAVEPYSVRVQGPLEGELGVSYTFTGTVVSISPPSANEYKWEATEQDMQIDAGSTIEAVSFAWTTPGTKYITVTVNSDIGSSTYIHMIKIQPDSPILPIYRLYGINFGPFVQGDPQVGDSVSEATIRDLMTQIAPYTKWVRTYGCGDGLEVAGRIARELNLKIAMGAWLNADTAANEVQIACLIDRARAGEVDLAIVGSEVMFRDELTADQVVAYIQQVKAALPDIPVTTADVYARIVDNPSIVEVVDVVMVHLYPYWEGILLDHAMALIHGRYQHVKSVAGEKTVILAETGWPSCGEQQSEAIASPENAGYYFLNFASWTQANAIPYFYFSAFDEPWKAAVEGPQGACWGIWDKAGLMKPGMQDVFDGKTLSDNWSGTAIPGGPGDPRIEFVDEPELGTLHDLHGQVWHVAPGEYRVVVYIHVFGQWWIKPYYTQPLTLIAPDGSWVADITTDDHGNDEKANKIVAFLIKTEDWPADNTILTPNQVDVFDVAKVEITRSPQ